MQEQFDEIKRFLDGKGVRYEVTEHEPVYTSEDAARIRGEDIRTGAKALIFKADANFVLCIVPGDRKIDTKKLKEILSCKDVRMATPEEVLRVSGCEIGSVHPVGNIMGIKTYADRHLFENEYVNFNAGLHTASMRMKSSDFLSLIRPEVVDYAFRIIEKKIWPHMFENDMKMDHDWRLADFPLNVGDRIRYREWNPDTEEYTGREYTRNVVRFVKTSYEELMKGGICSIDEDPAKYWTKEELERHGFYVMWFAD